MAYVTCSRFELYSVVFVSFGTANVSTFNEQRRHWDTQSRKKMAVWKIYVNRSDIVFVLKVTIFVAVQWLTFMFHN